MIAAGLALGWATLLGGVYGTAVLRRRALPRPERPPTSGAVLLARPCAGAEPGLLERLVSVRAARHHFSPLSVRFTVARPDDPARPSTRAAARALRALGFDAEALVVPTEAPNQKAAQLAGLVAAWPGEAPPVLVNVDSDVDLTDFDLDRLVAPLWAELGATWAPPAEVGGTTLADRASAAFLNGSLHGFQLLGALDPDGLVGKVMAVRLDRLAPAGGLAGLDTVLGEDMEIARRLRQAGYGQQMVPLAPRACPSGRSLAAVVGRYARWLAVIRAQRPALLISYPLMFGATTPIVALGLASGWPLIGLAALLPRLGLAWAARRWAGLPAGLPTLVVDWLLGDLVTWAAFLRAATTRQVRWRGRALTLAGAGREVRHAHDDG